jgi:acetyl-CoA carboxylase biotin carboxyl carrier protein
MDLSKEDVFKIINLIEESGYEDVRLEIGDFKLHVQKHASGAPVAEVAGRSEVPPARPAPAPVASAPASAPAVAAKGAARVVPDGAVVVRAPMLGTFYRAPSPGEKPFVEVGTKVKPDDTVCLVEVMKLFNSIKAGAAGTVLEILVENAAMVEHGQPLLVIRPE